MASADSASLTGLAIVLGVLAAFIVLCGKIIAAIARRVELESQSGPPDVQPPATSQTT